MEIVNKNSYNSVLRHHLKIRQNNWRPESTFPLVLWPYYATRTTYAENYFVRHTHYECWIVCNVEKGCLQVISNGKVHLVKEGETILMPPGPHTFTAVNGETIQRTLGMEGHLLRLILENLSLADCIVVKDFFTEEYEALFEEVYHLLGKRDETDAPRLSLLAYSILMYAARFVPRKTLPYEVIMSQQFIQRNLFQKITLQDLCKEAGCSRTRLCILFRQYTSFSPGDYIIELRHKYAKDLLATAPHMPIKLVASYCGYRNQLYFANDFKKRTGMTPSSYREKIQKKSDFRDEIFKNDSSV
ncbi:MAG: helix-turn-helix transcriptional regulator [Lentisphaeria bacterium]|nr:helix-turn-helix transcriptional regulator [Lentisphaeria bacterium]